MVLKNKKGKFVYQKKRFLMRFKLEISSQHRTKLASAIQYNAAKLISSLVTTFLLNVE